MADPSVPRDKTAGRTVTRLLPLAVLALVMALAFALGWHRYLSFKTIGPGRSMGASCDPSVLPW